MTRVIIAQLPVSNNIAELPGLAPEGEMDNPGCEGEMKAQTVRVG